MILRKFIPLIFVSGLLSFLFTSFSCSVQKKQKNNADSLLISIQRFPCFGRCPYYDAFIYESGYMLINRKGFMDNLGEYSSKATRSEMKELINMAEHISYLSLPDSFYNPGIADFPVTITRVKLDGKLKRVFDGEPDAPEDLKSFEKRLHDFFTQKDRGWQLVRKKADAQD